MRKVIFGGANSLDNLIARPNDDVDWLMWSDEAAALMAEFWPRFGQNVVRREID